MIKQIASEQEQTCRKQKKPIKPMTQKESENENDSHSWKIQHVIILGQAMDFHSPHIWIILSKRNAQIFSKAPCHGSV